MLQEVPPLSASFEGQRAATAEALDLLAGMMALNPAQRLTAEQVRARALKGRGLDTGACACAQGWAQGVLGGWIQVCVCACVLVGMFVCSFMASLCEGL